MSEHFDETKKMLQECNPDAEITDNMVWDSLNEQEHDKWTDCMDRLDELFGDNHCVVVGKVGTWRGRFDAANVFNGIKKAIQACIKDCDYIAITRTEDGLIHIKSSHHDGTNDFDLKIATEEGAEYADKWAYDDNEVEEREYDMILTIWNSDKYSRKCA